MTQNAPSLGPQGLSQDNRFMLSQSEWLAIQVYVAASMVLPTNDDQMRKALQLESNDDVKQFKDLESAYQDIQSHCTVWRDTTFPATVSLADDIVHYNGKVKVYYGALTPIINALQQNPDNDLMKRKLNAVLDTLAKQAKQYSDNAQNVYNDVKTFADETQTDLHTVTQLQASYQSKYGAQSEDRKQLEKDLKDWKNTLQEATDEYNHDVVVAATSPAYAWVLPPIGLIAAATVSGIYGAKATAAKRKMEAARDQINNLQKEIRRDVLLMQYIENAQTSMTSIKDKMTPALASVQKIQGIWSAIHSDLNNICNIIEQDIRKAIPLIMDLGVQEAIDAWAKVAGEADAYRTNAFITVDGQSQDSTKKAA